jgi:hypothetical protein
MLALIIGLCCVDFVNHIGVVSGVKRLRLAVSIEDGDIIQTLKHCV